MKRTVLILTLSLGATLMACGTKTADMPPSEVTPESDAGDTVEPETPVCPIVRTPKSLVRVAESDDIAETSGIVASKMNPDVFWIHNDSGDVARAFAVSKTGAVLATLNFDEKAPTDIEDIAIEDTGTGQANLYFGDIGDNGEERKSLTIHRVAEPKVEGGKNALLNVPSEKMTVLYPDGPHNAETLLFDPITKELFIATKKEGGPSYIHRVGPFEAGAKVTTTKIATVEIDYATGGDISRDGKYVAIRNEGKTAWLWLRRANESLADIFEREPCSLPIASEKQGEALGFLPDNTGYVTISEGALQSINLATFE